jgi:RTX calcium-binding nonapeptide repeat (4 copies)
VIITGEPAEGEILTASSTLADEDGLGTLEYHWTADGVDVAGDGSPTLLLTQEMVGKVITAVVFYTDQRGTLERAESAPTTEVANVNDLPAGLVIITGTPTEDQILTASNTLVDADGMGAASYQWQANGSNIAGATDATLTLAQAQVGRIITVLASYTDGQGTAEAVGSAATAAVGNVNDLPTGAVTITGTPAEGEILTASQALTDEDGLGTINYRWRADGTDIAGATNASFTLTQAQVGSTITAVASYTDQQGTPESVGSPATGIVAPPALPFYQYTLTASSTAGQTEAVLYDGPAGYLLYEFAGSSAGEAVVGTTSNDFIHLGADDDAADGGEGDDVMDGGTGSNFLSGGAGRDVFFLDGRNGETTWSTITDWHAGEELALWGWRQGVSQATWLADAGGEGYHGATLHADLDANGVIDTSVTWVGRRLADLPASAQHDGLLWFA